MGFEGGGYCQSPVDYCAEDVGQEGFRGVSEDVGPGRRRHGGVEFSGVFCEVLALALGGVSRNRWAC